MSALPRDPVAKVVMFSSVVEVGTALVLLVDPALVVALLLGTAGDTTVRVVARCFGISLLALSAACWPERRSGESAAADLRGMLIYNALIAVFLGYLGAVERMGGWLLWPAVTLHGLVGLLLIATWRGPHREKPLGTLTRALEKR